MTEWHLTGELTFSIGQHSTAGVKKRNEDAIGIRIPKGMLLDTKGAVAVIADGVSAAEAGEEASQICVTNFLSDYFSTPDTWSVSKSTSRVLTALNRWLYGKGQHYLNPQRGYVCTLSCLIIKSHTAYLFHVGDTRIYRFRNGELEQLTRDHATRINEKQTYLTRAMGLDVKLDVDFKTVPVETGDIFVLTSDGVHDFLRDNEITRALLSHTEDYEKCCNTLIELALENHSHDNLSCQILRVDSLPPQNVNEVYEKLTELPFPPPLKKDMVLDGYRIEREIHASSRSQVYVVEEVETEKKFCMKTPSPNYDDDPAYIERFILESWIGSRIQSTNVVKTVNTQQTKTMLYYLTEYIGGISLEQWIKENPKPAVQEVIYLAEQIAKGIRAFHRQEILHQDIKPGNVIIDSHGTVKILDFGSCYSHSIAEISTPLDRDKILGTADYSSPEVVLGNPASYQADIFSLGVIVFEMLTGEKPFDGKLLQCRTQKAYLETKYIFSYDLNPLVPVWIDGAIRKALRFDPTRRYGDVDEFVYELTHPNPKYKKYGDMPMSVKNPLLLWQSISAGLLVALCVCIYFLLGK